MQGSDSYRLVVRRGPQPNQVYELEEAVINVGRDITNTLVINDREISRHHMRLMRGSEGYSIEDLGSTNGSFVNGKRISGVTPLKNGDMVGMGETVTLGYEIVTASQQAASQQAAQQAPQPQAQQPQAQQPQQPPVDNANYQPPVANAGAPQQQAYQPPAQQAPQQAVNYDAPAYDEAQGDYDQQGGYYPPQNYAPPPPGYDYDPYAMREEGGSNTMRIVLFGCLGLMIFCCLITVVGFVLVDTLNLYCDLPIVRNIFEALGLLSCSV